MHFNNPISRTFPLTSKRLEQSMSTISSYTNVLKPTLIVGFLGLSMIAIPAQAAVKDTAAGRNASRTASLQLISLNADNVPLDNGADDLSDIADMLESADQADDLIDSVADETVLNNESPIINTDIPAEVGINNRRFIVQHSFIRHTIN